MALFNPLIHYRRPFIVAQSAPTRLPNDLESTRNIGQSSYRQLCASVWFGVPSVWGQCSS